MVVSRLDETQRRRDVLGFNFFFNLGVFIKE